MEQFRRIASSLRKTIVIGYAAPQHYLVSGLGGNNRRGPKQMSSTAFLLGVTALVVCKIATRIGVNAGHFEDLPRPTQID